MISCVKCPRRPGNTRQLLTRGRFYHVFASEYRTKEITSALLCLIIGRGVSGNGSDRIRRAINERSIYVRHSLVPQMNHWMEMRAPFCDLIIISRFSWTRKYIWTAEYYGVVSHKSPKMPRSVRIWCRARTARKYGEFRRYKRTNLYGSNPWWHSHLTFFILLRENGCNLLLQKKSRI